MFFKWINRRIDKIVKYVIDQVFSIAELKEPIRNGIKEISLEKLLDIEVIIYKLNSSYERYKKYKLIKL